MSEYQNIEEGEEENTQHRPLSRPLSPSTYRHLAQFADTQPEMIAFLQASDALSTDTK